MKVIVKSLEFRQGSWKGSEERRAEPGMSIRIPGVCKVQVYLEKVSRGGKEE